MDFDGRLRTYFLIAAARSIQQIKALLACFLLGRDCLKVFNLSRTIHLEELDLEVGAQLVQA